MRALAKLKATALSVLVGGLGIGASLASAKNLFPYAVTKDQLSNGLQVISVPFESPGTVAFYIVVRVGSRDEVEAGKTGFAHFFEHMMFRGTDKVSPDQYGAIMQRCAGSYNASTGHDTTSFYTVANSSCIEQLFQIESDRFQNLKYSEQAFRTEAQAILGEYTKNFASPYSQIEEKLLGIAFTQHTYKHTVMGFLDDIKEMPQQYKYSQQFFQRFYRPENTSLIIVGDIQATQNLILAKKYFGNWQQGSFRSLAPKEPPQIREQRGQINFPGKSTILKIAYKGPAYSDLSLDSAALSVLLELQFSTISPLFRKLVIEEKKAKNISYGVGSFRDPFLIGFSVELYDEKDLTYIQSAIDTALNLAKTQLVLKTDLDNVKSAAKYGTLNSLTTPLSVASTLGHYVALTRDPNSLDTYMLNIERLKAEDIRSAAQKYLVHERKTVVTLSPAKESK